MSPQPPETLELSAHCLLRLTTALLLEVGGIDHGHQQATAELNRRTGRRLGAKAWLKILEPAYRARFMPGDDTPLA